MARGSNMIRKKTYTMDDYLEEQRIKEETRVREETAIQKRTRERGEIHQRELAEQKEKENKPSAAKTVLKLLNPVGTLTDIANDKINKYLNSRPKAVNQLLKATENMKMTEFSICRDPIEAAIKKISNFGTKGKLVEHQKKLNYDEIFHLYLVITFENGARYSIEKNQVVTVYKNPPTRSGECKKVDIRWRNKTFREVLEVAEKTHNFYRYDFAVDNCQAFVKKFVNTTGVYEFDDFIYQEFASVIAPHLRKFGGAVTDLAALFGRLFTDNIG